MAVGPGGVLALRRARGIKEALLRQQHERSLRRDAARHALLGGGDLLQRPAEMNRARASACGILPGNRAIQRVVDLEDARPIAIGPSRERYPSGSASPAIRSIWRGVTSKRMARELGSSCSDVTSTPVTISPPSARRYAASASTNACDPPFGNGQPMSVRAFPARARSRR